MATEIKAPTFPESVAEGTVAAWHKKPGDSVERDELIVEIETDKVVLEVVAPEAGTLTDVMAEEGDTVESEQVLVKSAKAKPPAIAARKKVRLLAMTARRSQKRNLTTRKKLKSQRR